MRVGSIPEKWIAKKAKGGFRGYPVGAIALYGPDNRRASKVVAGVFDRPDADPLELRKWFAESGDVRTAPQINSEIVAFLRGHRVRTVSMADAILGCPHEEGIDYPEGGQCPHCPFWPDRDRWAETSLNWR